MSLCGYVGLGAMPAAGWAAKFLLCHKSMNFVVVTASVLSLFGSPCAPVRLFHSSEPVQMKDSLPAKAWAELTRL